MHNIDGIRTIAPRLGLGVALGFWEWGTVLLGDNCPRTNIDVQMTVLSIHEILL